MIDSSLNEYDSDTGLQTRFAIAPYGTSETRGERIMRLEELGTINPFCDYCQEFYKAKDPATHFAPRHTASPGCRSGKRPHCTCDTCF